MSKWIFVSVSPSGTVPRAESLARSFTNTWNWLRRRLPLWPLLIPDDVPVMAAMFSAQVICILRRGQPQAAAAPPGDVRSSSARVGRNVFTVATANVNGIAPLLAETTLRGWRNAVLMSSVW